jgi:hypothetical protein
MTRINANIPPHELVNKHLMGEFFEIRRVRIYKPDFTIKNFRFGAGHVKFFSTFKTTTLKRVDDISVELLKRGLVTEESVASTIKLFHDSWGSPDTYADLVYDYTDDDTDKARLRLVNSLISRVFKKSTTTKYHNYHIDILHALHLLECQTSAAIELKTNIINAIKNNDTEQLTELIKQLP